MDFWAESSAYNASTLGGATALIAQSAKVRGFHIIASPYTPKLVGVFQFESDAAAEEHWQSLLPRNAEVDVLMTHGPPRGTADVTSKGRRVGDTALRDAVAALAHPPLLWIVGHVHASYGVHTFPHPAGNVVVLNVAVNDLRLGRDTYPMVVDIRIPAGRGS